MSDILKIDNVHSITMNLSENGAEKSALIKTWNNNETRTIVLDNFEESMLEIERHLKAFWDPEKPMPITAFPHASKYVTPVARYKIKGRWVGLYYIEGRLPSAPYSMYWDDERNPIQHAMTANEVFRLIGELQNI